LAPGAVLNPQLAPANRDHGRVQVTRTPTNTLNTGRACRSLSDIAVAMSACLPGRRSPAGRTGSRGAKLAAGAWGKKPTGAIFALSCATPSSARTHCLVPKPGRGTPEPSDYDANGGFLFWAGRGPHA